MIFGSKGDFNLFVGINRELLSNVVEQEILFYKLSLDQMQANIYGEATEKVYWQAVKLNALIERGDQQISTDEFGPDVIRSVKFNLLQQDLTDADVHPELGDIVYWMENYYEVDNVNINQLFVGKDPDYALTTYGPNFGGSVSVMLETHLTRVDKTGITSRYYESSIDQQSIAAASFDKVPGILPNGNTGGSSTQGQSGNPLQYTFPVYLKQVQPPTYTTNTNRNIAFPVKVATITTIAPNTGSSGNQSAIPNSFQGNTFVNSGITASNAAEFITVWNSLNSASGSISSSQTVAIPGGTALSFTLTPVNVNLRPQAAWCYPI